MDDNKYLGEDCLRGHGGLRYTSNRNCCQCMKDHQLSENNIKHRLTPEFKAHRAVSKKTYDRSPEKVFIHLNRYAKRRSKLIGVEYSLTTDDLIKLFERQNGICPYLGIPMSREQGVGLPNPHKVSIDRIDSNKGYTVDNIVLCCYWANRAKCDTSQAYFINMCKSVAANASHLLISTIKES